MKAMTALRRLPPAQTKRLPPVLKCFRDYALGERHLEFPKSAKGTVAETIIQLIGAVESQWLAVMPLKMGAPSFTCWARISTVHGIATASS